MREEFDGFLRCSEKVMGDKWELVKMVAGIDIDLWNFLVRIRWEMWSSILSIMGNEKIIEV